MKLQDLYINKFCPHQPRYKCSGSECAKFISCMAEEIDALYVIGGNGEEVDSLDKELAKSVQNESLL